MNSRLMLCVAAAALLGLHCFAAGAQSSPAVLKGDDELRSIVQRLVEEIQQLRLTVEELQARVIELEERQSPATVEVLDAETEELERSAATNVRVARVESVTLREPDSQALAKAAQARAEAKAKEKEIGPLETQRNNLMNCCSHWPHCSLATKEARDHHRIHEVARNRQREDISKRIVKIRQDMQRLNGDAERFERESKLTRHVIRGWDGSRMIVLHTERDLSQVVSKAVKGAYVKWTGKLVSDEAGVQSWNITSLRVVDRPTVFNERGG